MSNSKRTQREWGASGVAFPPIELKLDSDRRLHVREVLEPYNVSLENFEGFIEALESAIANYKCYEQIAESSRPAAVRKNLRKARNAANRLYNLLQGLDGNSRQLLDRAKEGRTSSHLSATANTIGALDSAIRLANEYPQVGRLREPHRIFLAVEVGSAMESCLGTTPTSTNLGPFVAVLEVVLEVATGKESRTVHELARKALLYDGKLEHEGGVVEYRLPNQD